MTYISGQQYLELGPEKRLALLYLHRIISDADAEALKQSCGGSIDVIRLVLSASLEASEQNILFASEPPFVSETPLLEMTAAVGALVRNELLGSEAAAVSSAAFAVGDIAVGELMRVLSATPEFIACHHAVSAEPTAHNALVERQRIALNNNFDAYAAATLEASDKPLLLQKLKRIQGKSKVRILVMLFGGMVDTPDEYRLELEKLLPNQKSEWTLCSPNHISADFVDQFDIFITNNNFLFSLLGKFQEIFGALENCLSVVWLFDNHHQFDFSARCTECFDFAFPAHSNQVSYLAGRRSIVMSALPCACIQFSRSLATKVFEERIREPRSDEPWGLHTSYPGRLSWRQGFLARAGEQMSAPLLRAIPQSEQTWWSKTLEERFAEIMQKKVSVALPVHNDVPLRVFDALLAGTIPVVPVGLPDLRGIFSGNDRYRLPVLEYQTGNVTSLKRTVAAAIEIFDEDGYEGMRARHEAALKRHMGVNRVAEMAADVLTTQI